MAILTGGWLLLFIGGAMLWVLLIRRHYNRALVGLWLCSAAVAGAHHHSWRNDFARNEIGEFADLVPKLVRVRGQFFEEPVRRRQIATDPLVGRALPEVSTTVIGATSIFVRDQWVAATGRARLSFEGSADEIGIGDEIELTAMLSLPSGPMNPGERDFRSALLDDRIRAQLSIRGTRDAIVRLNQGSWGFNRFLARLRNWGKKGIESGLHGSEQRIAAALLLGDTTMMSGNEWEDFTRTGVVHVLAISGQHLVILAAVFWFLLRLLRVPTKPAALIVAVVLLTYALLTGGRPSAMRAAVMVCAVCVAILIRARAMPLNTFCLAWLVVLILKPTDLFNPGFQLSFLCVAVLVWGIPRWFPIRELTPLEQLIEESRSIGERAIRAFVAGTLRLYLITAVLGLATMPLLMYWQNVISPAGFLIGPVVIVLTTIALISGFFLLFVWPIPILSDPVAWVVEMSLASCQWCVRQAAQIRFGYWYTGSVPLWWVFGFYAIVAAWLFASEPSIAKRLPRRFFLIAILGWSIGGLGLATIQSSSDEMRVTFLAVEHGGCAVIETPDGRVMLYDAGSTLGPSVTKRVIAPYLWSRGIRRIDEVFLSHADLDHFNCLPALLDRFAVGQVTYTPTFSDKPNGAVRLTLNALNRGGVQVRTASTGDRFLAGEVELTVLHPPKLGEGPGGVENVRSLVINVRHLGHTVLLTGDLEGAGISQVVAGESELIDVLMTPHHGSERDDRMARWAKPRLVVSSQGRNDAGKAEAIYRQRNTPYLATWPEGAITIRSHRSGLIVETFATKRQDVIRAGSGPR